MLARKWRAPAFRSVALGLLFAGWIAPPALRSDTLRLVNGNSFEGVITTEGAESVKIRLAYGELVLPRSMVLEIERGGSPLSEYFERHDRLTRDPSSAGEDWLELAFWARQRGLDHGAVEAAKTAARLEPRLEGLAPLMRGLGYVLDEELGRWMTWDDFMRRQGFVESEGQWVTREELAARQREREEAIRERRDRAQQDRLAQAVELLALTQVERYQEAREPRPQVVGYPVGGFPVAVFPGGWVGGGYYYSDHRKGISGGGDGAVHRVRSTGFTPEAAEQLLRRQPGSIVPLAPTSSARIRGRGGRR